MRIETKDTEGRPNGYLIPIWNALERPGLRPDQVYLTVIAPHCRKGPHLHMKRRGVFAVLSGNVAVISGDLDDKENYLAQGDLIEIHPGVPCAIYNYGDTDAFVLNMPSPAWSEDDPDDWPVENWIDPEGWNE